MGDTPRGLRVSSPATPQTQDYPGFTLFFKENGSASKKYEYSNNTPKNKMDHLSGRTKYLTLALIQEYIKIQFELDIWVNYF